MSETMTKASGNRLLDLLDPDALANLGPRLTRVPLNAKQRIYDQDGAIEHVYFPLTGMLSMVTNLADGMQAEVGVVGNEGMAGAALIAGVTQSFTETMVQMPGHAMRMAARDFRTEMEENAPFRELLLRYYEAFQAQVMQTAACNGRHELEQRLARWLLMCHDREPTAALPLTQEFIAMMLAVHRPSITVTAGILHRAGLIRYGGGKITIVDREGLEAASCECYAAVKRRFDALLPPGKPRT